MMIAMHQCTHFCESPKLSHEKAVKRVVKHLLGIRHVGMQATINYILRLAAFTNSDFSNGWNRLNLDNVHGHANHLV